MTCKLRKNQRGIEDERRHTDNTGYSFFKPEFRKHEIREYQCGEERGGVSETISSLFRKGGWVTGGSTRGKVDEVFSGGPSLRRKSKRRRLSKGKKIIVNPLNPLFS